jgi:hypothetical protein
VVGYLYGSTEPPPYTSVKPRLHRTQITQQIDKKIKRSTVRLRHYYRRQELPPACRTAVTVINFAPLFPPTAELRPSCLKEGKRSVPTDRLIGRRALLLRFRFSFSSLCANLLAGAIRRFEREVERGRADNPTTNQPGNRPRKGGTPLKHLLSLSFFTPNPPILFVACSP